jgi:hypothetical protein
MKINSQVKPSKPASLIGAIIGFFFAIFGVAFFISISKETNFDDTGGPLIPMFFGLFVLVCLSIMVMNLWNFFSKKGVASFDVNTESDTTLAKPTDDVVTRLRQLEQLKNEQLITDKEYAQKREEIMQQKW